MNKQINESQAKVYFGWVPSSDMLSNYSHITSRDVNNTMLEINGLKPSEQVTGKKAKICRNCQKPNDTQDSFCGYCAKPLDFKTLMDVEFKAKRGANVIDKATEKRIPITKEDLKILIQDMAKNGEIKL